MAKNIYFKLQTFFTFANGYFFATFSFAIIEEIISDKMNGMQSETVERNFSHLHHNRLRAKRKGM